MGYRVFQGRLPERVIEVPSVASLLSESLFVLLLREGFTIALVLLGIRFSESL